MESNPFKNDALAAIALTAATALSDVERQPAKRKAGRCHDMKKKRKRRMVKASRRRNR